MKIRILLVSWLSLLLVGGFLVGCDFFVDQGTPGNTKFAFVANQNPGGTGSVSAYVADSGTGALTQVSGSPFGASNSTLAVGSDASGKFLYALNQTGGVSGFGIDQNTGQLSSVGAAVPTGTNPVALAVDPLARFLYVAEAGPPTGVRGFSISSSGVLSPLAGSPFSLGSSVPNSLAMDIRGLFLFVGTQDGQILSFPIQSDGSLGTMASISTPSGVAAIAVDPTVRFLYAADGVHGVSAFTITTGTGALTVVTGSPFSAGLTPVGVAVDSVGKFVFTANRDSNNASAFQININTGALTASPSSPFPANTRPVSVAADPSARFAYVVNNGSNNVSIFTVDQGTGALNPGTTPTAATGAAPVWVVATP